MRLKINSGWGVPVMSGFRGGADPSDLWVRGRVDPRTSC